MSTDLYYIDLYTELLPELGKKISYLLFGSISRDKGGRGVLHSIKERSACSFMKSDHGRGGVAGGGGGFPVCLILYLILLCIKFYQVSS